MRVVEGADPYREGERKVGLLTGGRWEEGKNRRGYKYAFSGGRRWQPKLTDEAFFSSVEVLL